MKFFSVQILGSRGRDVRFYCLFGFLFVHLLFCPFFLSTSWAISTNTIEPPDLSFKVSPNMFITVLVRHQRNLARHYEEVLEVYGCVL